MRIIVFGGTTEGRKLSEGFAEAGINHIVSVATDYGEEVLQENPLVSVHQGRLDENEMKEFILENGDLVFDATHPYANLVTENIRKACEETGREYVRIIRDSHALLDSQDDVLATYGEDLHKLRFFDDTESCVEALKSFDGNVLLTTGSKDLKRYIGINNLYVRVLPSEESIRLCEEAGIKRDHIIAMQGPFTLDLNKALISQFGIDLMVTKESGSTGGYPEKIQAALEKNISVYVIGRPTTEQGMSVVDALEKYCGKKDCAHGEPTCNCKIFLIGIGPGDEDYLTIRASNAIQSSDIVFGAKRMISPYSKTKETLPFYLARDVLPVILDRKPKQVAVLFSGDSGFYSGAEKMRYALEEGLLEYADNDFTFDIEIVPGISSVSFFASRIGIGYSDSVITSIHGRSGNKEYMDKLLEDIEKNEKVFTLLSGKEDVGLIIEELRKKAAREGKKYKVILGYELSYPKETITELIAGDRDSTDISLNELPEGLYVSLIMSIS